MSFCDTQKDIIEWSSEEFFVSYRCKTDNKIHRYFPDFKIKVRGKDGKIRTKVIEIKPRGECSRPIKPAKITRRYLNEAYAYMKNTSKWAAGREWCKNRGYEFVIMTERELGLLF